MSGQQSLGALLNRDLSTDWHCSYIAAFIYTADVHCSAPFIVSYKINIKRIDPHARARLIDCMMDHIIVVVAGQYAQWLPNDQREPHEHVGHGAVQVARHHYGEGHLQRHAREGPDAEHFERHGDQVLVEECGHDEHGPRDGQLGVALLEQRHVQVAHAPLVHGNVPVLPEVVHRLGVPPVAVEFPIAESKQLGKEVERRVEIEIKPNEPDDVIGNLGKAHTHRLIGQ